MKKVLWVFFTFFTLCAKAQQKIDVLHYRFHIQLNDANDNMNCVASISVKFLKAVDAISFDLIGLTGNGKGMKTGKVLGPQVTGSVQTPEKITIQCARAFNPGDTATFTIPYNGVPADGLIISKNKYGRRTFFADNWPDRGHNWMACVDNPADKASVEFIVTAPEHYQVVSNGLLVEETNLKNAEKRTHWREDVPVPTKVMVIGVADFAVNLSGMIDNCIPVYSWVYPEDRDQGFHDYGLATEILPFFIRNVGPYGYKKLANVQSKTTFGGLENANTIFYMENSITGRGDIETLLSHEIAHQWFGDMATEKSFSHLWLSEGFATYMAILYMEYKYGADTARSMLREDREKVIEFVETSDRPVVDEASSYMELLNANSYQKGSWILHMLHRQLGDSIFWKSVRSYYATYAGKNADTRDLQQIFEKISGKNLSGFFRQWLYTAGIPKLDLSWSYQPGEKKLSVSIKQLQKETFSFPLEVKIKNNKATILNISKRDETFTLLMEEKPKGLVLDPNTSMLFTATVREKK